VFRRTQDPLWRSEPFSYRAVTWYRGPFQVASLKSEFCNSVQSVLQPQEASLLVWADPVSLAATQGIAICFLFLQVLRCFSSLGVSQPRYEFTRLYCPIKGSGFPHSEIPGSVLTYSSPRHIGVSAVLHRLLVPRHPPCALSNLTKSKSGSQLGSRTCVACLALFQCRLSSFQRTSLKCSTSEPSKPNAKRQLSGPTAADSE
jgi:hypothetical protein